MDARASAVLLGGCLSVSLCCCSDGVPGGWGSPEASVDVAPSLPDSAPSTDLLSGLPEADLPGDVGSTDVEGEGPSPDAGPTDAGAPSASCASPQGLTLAPGGPTVLSGDTTGAADEYPGVSCGNVNGPWPGGQLYYRVRLAAGMVYRISLVTGSWDGALYAFPAATACSGASVDAACTGYSSDQVGNNVTESLFIAPATAGDWVIAVDSWSAPYDYGPFTLTIETGTPPLNASCANAQALALGPGTTTVQGDTSAFVPNEHPTLSCGGKTPYTGPQLYYKLPLVGGTTYRFKLTADFLAFFYLFTSATCIEADIEADCASDGASGDTMWAAAQTPLELAFSPKKSGTYHLAVDSWSPSVSGAFTLDVSELVVPTLCAPLSFNFEGDCGGLAATNDWECGCFAFQAGASCDPAAAPPKAAHSGTAMWGTRLNDCYAPLGNNVNGGPSGCCNELPNDDSVLRFRVKIPAGWISATLSYWSWEDLHTPYDWAEVRVDGIPVSSTQLCGPYAAPTAWVKRTVDLSAQVGQTVEIAFHMLASLGTGYAGWYIDDVSVTGGP